MDLYFSGTSELVFKLGWDKGDFFMIKPIEIAKKLGISTSALRHYESWGIVPPPERSANGYRIYTEEHVAYFECIRAMNSGFGMHLIRQIMPLIQENKLTEALWIVNEAQAKQHQEKLKAEQALQALELEELEHFSTRLTKEFYSIREVADKIDVPTSTLRHWEKEKLITPKRDPENGYRIYSRSDIRKLLIIRTIRSAVFYLDIVRDVVNEIDHDNLAHARKLAKDSLVYMDYLIMERLRGGYYLYKLYEKVKPSPIKRDSPC
ncbi:MerR family transcriptional regulator [Oceanobacillus profundus]|uniref:MerR family transcriptional regulator n=2 Tax=Oceanobacillus TaxID=182709 RepID=UPI0026E3DE1F|nr:MerR family transcriptional regulator [Oceanobacillus profundus]